MSPLLDGVRDARVERVAQVLDDQTDAGAVSAQAEPPREVVRTKAQLSHGVADPLLSLRAYRLLAVEHPGRGLEAHPGTLCDVLEGRALGTHRLSLLRRRGGEPLLGALGVAHWIPPVSMTDEPSHTVERWLVVLPLRDNVVNCCIGPVTRPLPGGSPFRCGSGFMDI